MTNINPEDYPYTTTVKTYKGIPFSYTIKKTGYQDKSGMAVGGTYNWVLLEAEE